MLVLPVAGRVTLWLLSWLYAALDGASCLPNSSRAVTAPSRCCAGCVIPHPLADASARAPQLATAVCPVRMF
jgi:hypothetical protein